jgi:hypothetical protein
MTNKTTREYRTSHGTIESIERTAPRTDAYQLVAEDSIPIFKGYPSFAEHLARRFAKKKRKPLTDAQKEAEWKRFVKRITPEVWAEVKAKYRAEKAAEDDAREARIAKRRAKIGESLRARVAADQEKWGR